MSFNKKINSLISNSIGPSPWYWETFPRLTVDNIKYIWKLKELRKHLYIPYLTSGNDEVKLVINTYTRFFSIKKNIFGVWYCKDDNIIIRIFDINNLRSFSLIEVSENLVHTEDPYVIIGTHIAEIEINIGLGTGRHRLQVCKELKGLDEIFCIVNSNRHRENDTTIFVIKPKVDEVEVLPQLWFNRDKFDIGYQWITRVVREPKSKIIYGDGIRIGKFKLKKDGCNLDKWVTF